MTSYTILYALVKTYLITPCDSTAGFWIWYFTPVPVLGGCMYAIGKHLQNLHSLRQSAGWTYLPTDLQWSPSVLLKFPLTSLFAGLTAGLLGIGGGMIIGPLFIQVGMQPQVGTASCAFMILFTSLSTLVQYLAAGRIGWRSVLFFAGVGFVSGQIGQRVVDGVIRRTGRPSYVIFLLGGVIGVATCCMVVYGSFEIREDSRDGVDIFSIDTEGVTCGE